MKYFGITQIVLAMAVFAIAIDAAKLQRVNPNRARGGGRGRRIVKKLRNGRKGKQLFGSRVPIIPAAPLFPPAPLPAAPVFGPHPPPLVQPLQLIEVQPVLPRIAPVVVPQQVVRTEVVPPAPAYGAPPAPVPAPAPAPLPEEPINAIIELKSAPAASLYTVPRTAASQHVAVVAAGPPIAITRSVYNAPGITPGVDDWNYAFETENGIKQEAAGEMRDIGDSIVMVMKGSYEYIGFDQLTYVVDWVADENGFRASAPHLPKPVAIPFPEQQAAVDAQIRFAAEEDLLRAAGSAPVPSYGAPLPPIVEVRAPVPSYGAPAPLPAVVEVRAPVAEYGLPAYGGY